jgi:hypothetical protein
MIERCAASENSPRAITVNNVAELGRGEGLRYRSITRLGDILVPLAAKKATTTIPIVVTRVSDPIGAGLVASLARPGGNITGLTTASPELSGKRLELLREALPGVQKVTVLWTRS